MSHCLYYMEDPISKILHAKKFLKKGEASELVIFHQGDGGISDYYSFALNHINRNSKHESSVADFKRQLDGKNVKNELKMLPSYVDMRGVFEENNKDVMDRIITFFIQANAKLLPEKLHSLLVEKLKKETNDNKFQIPIGALTLA
eukprot:TRINITY_DN6183_c0_g1_i1.p1 TRINITY_DN6183_c0_g1~~TRINITY_DN6183_c0_g1_i1.p1  ORF type:complete len:145 (-),score=53.13 TRINITY_DN6183_c0_g1_i1:192-626(-)